MIKGTWLPFGSQILDSTNGRPTCTYSSIERPPIHWLLTSEAKPTDYSIVFNSWHFHPNSVVLIAVALTLRWPSGSSRTQWRTGPASAILSYETASSVTGWTHYCCFVSTFPIDGWPSFEIARPRTLLLYFILVAWCPMAADKSWNFRKQDDVRLFFFVEWIWRNSFPRVLVVSAMHIKFMDSKHLIANRYARVLVPALELKAFITLL